MGWLASFKGLRGLGVPPLIAAVALAALFFLVRRNTDVTAPAAQATA